MSRDLKIDPSRLLGLRIASRSLGVPSEGGPASDSRPVLGRKVGGKPPAPQPPMLGGKVGNKMAVVKGYLGAKAGIKNSPAR